MNRLTRLVFDYKGGRGPAHRFRVKRIKLLKDIINSLPPDQEIRIIDLGGTEIFWNAVGYDYLRSRQVKIFLLNLGEVPVSEDRRDLFVPITGDACDFDTGKRKFDVCFSNSVIEHVGDINRMISFAETMKRLAPIYVCQTPNFWFPIEPHFFFLGFQFLPEPMRVRLVQHFALGHFPKTPDVIEAYRLVQSCHLLDKTLFRTLFDDAEIQTERFLLFSKSYTAVRRG